MSDEVFCPAGAGLGVSQERAGLLGNRRWLNHPAEVGVGQRKGDENVDPKDESLEGSREDFVGPVARSILFWT